MEKARALGQVLQRVEDYRSTGNPAGTALPPELCRHEIRPGPGIQVYGQPLGLQRNIEISQQPLQLPLHCPASAGQLIFSRHQGRKEGRAEMEGH